ncbi:unnamed protein product [Dovyalis caffra]|uniref:Sucrose transporter 4 n=1 Tax=Dovyalis caffra TaxID=77055 RepID=A0AAV1SBW0_9ROSI|nr:unnamed protein product [Dovyalis caffra]
MPVANPEPNRASRARQTNRPPPARPPHQSRRVPLRQLLSVTSIAGGIQFGWALQLSLLTPYVQELGIPHQWASIIWLCGPLSGLFVQPLVGLMSDRCTSRFGRRRPFIVAGAILIAGSVLIIGHSADIGWWLGDRGDVRPRAIGAFVFGFWILDVANNMTQGPCRALLADLTGKDHRRTRVANAYFSLFMAVGNILGFATGSYSGWYKVFPFTVTSACDIDCANLKSAFYLDIVFIAITAYISISTAQESPLDLSARSMFATEEIPGQSNPEQEAFLWELFGTFRYFPWTVWIILLVTALNWIGWFPFLLFDTDWMGREIYGGKPNEGQNYNAGVRMGAFGLMFNSVILGVTSVLMEKLCSKWGAGFMWGLSNILMALCFLSMLILSYVARHIGYIGHHPPPDSIIVAALVIFAVLGMPLAITYSVPYALVSSRIESLGLGQGLSMGVLNLAIVLPQVVVSLGSGPWDQLFGGGNSPAIAVGALAAFTAGIIAILGISRSPERKRQGEEDGICEFVRVSRGGNQGKLILEEAQSVEKAKKVELFYLLRRVMMVGLLLLLPHRHSQGSLPQRDRLISVVGKGIQIKWLLLEHVIVAQCSLSSICRFSKQPFTVISINTPSGPIHDATPPPHIMKITFLKEHKLYWLRRGHNKISSGFDISSHLETPRKTPPLCSLVKGQVTHNHSMVLFP